MGIPTIIFQARNFDVPLMVLLSGISFSLYSSKSYSSYPSYLYSRFIRLIIPTWIFLVFYNSMIWAGNNDIPSTYNLCLQFSLIGGSDIGIWIIRIFFSMAIIAPFLLKINNQLISNKAFFITLFVTYIIYEIFLYNSRLILPEELFKITKLIILFTVSYGVIFLFGIRIPSLKSKEIKLSILVFGIVFFTSLSILYAQNNKIIPTQQFKYPPQIYYFSYALFASLVLFYLTKFHESKLYQLRLFQFIGRSTLWIYLWHWFFIKVYNYINIDLHYFSKYMVIYSSTIVLVYVQTSLVSLVTDRKILNTNKNRLLIKLFTG